jgi:fucose permease
VLSAHATANPNVESSIQVHDYNTFLIVSIAWGWSSTLPSLSTQAAMTWLWAEKAGPWLQLNNAGFGIGALTAPLLLAWDINTHDTYHNAYFLIAGGNIVVAFTPLLLPSPRQDKTKSLSNLLEAPEKQSNLSVRDEDGALARSTKLASGEPVPIRNMEQVATNRAIAGSRAGLGLWITLFVWFIFYVATELGVANWASPYATLEGVMGEDEAALLTTVYYGAFTLTRLLAAQITAMTSAADGMSILVVWICDIGALGSLVILVFAGRLQSTFMLWLAMGMLGMFTGPLW